MQERKRGYVDEMKKAGLYDPELIKEVNYNNLKADITVGINSLIESEKQVDAIYFATNTISMIGVKHLMELNINIQKDVQVVCFDKSDAFDFINFQIPHIIQPIPEMGRYAVDLLVQQIDKKKPMSGKVELFAELANS